MFDVWISNLKSLTKNCNIPAHERLFLANSLLDTQPLNVPATNMLQRDELTRSEMALILRDMKIPAIKEIRIRLNLGLKEAKEMVDKWVNDVDFVDKKVVPKTREELPWRDVNKPN